MKVFFLDYILNVSIVLCALVVSGWLYEVGWGFYYQHANISNFYQSSGLLALDVCEGDEHQSVVSDRQVFGTDVGYSADLTKELNWITEAGPIKVYEENKKPFVENKEGNQLIQNLPTTLSAGEYEWTFYITLDIYGHDRDVIPPVKSNIFNVLECQDETIDTNN